MGSTLVGSAVKNERIMGQKLMCYGALAKRSVAIGAASTLSAQERHGILQGDIGIIGVEPNLRARARAGVIFSPLLTRPA